MSLFKKQNNNQRQPRIENSRAQAYHYSSRRSNNTQNVGRQTEADIDMSLNKKSFSFKKLTPLIPSYVASLILLIGVFYLTTLSTSPEIIIINNNSKTELINKKILSDKASAHLKSSIFYRFKPTFNKTKVAEDLKSASPEIVSIKISINPLRHKPQIRVELSEPSLLLSTNAGNLYVVSSDGRILADSAKSSTEFHTTNLVTVQDQTGVKLELGKSALTSSQVDFINQIKFQTDRAGLDIESMAIMPGGSELDVRYKDTAYYVKYNLLNDARKQSGAFLAFRDSVGKAGVSAPAQYVDVRVPQRVYVK